ncbi:three component ABC system middle component [Bacillus anthracis]|uniref:three component ABC system middle component n=1 Tax=Bacillus anthracis TaxID=1392 RepID=UPI00099DC998|nr:three component ABC system middle component [Bacillus anthracis]OPD59413.1 hypothetical protein BVG01_07835 [Bacillus anthracis]
MGVLNKEIQIMQNPALGALLLHYFVEGYLSGKKEESVPIPLVFILLPIIFHNNTLEYLTATRRSSGLRVFVNKMSDSKVSKRDLIIDIHSRASLMKKTTLHSLRLSIATNLLEIDYNSGTVKLPFNSVNRPKRTNLNSKMVKASEKLGYWCSQLTLQEISIILKVGF